MKNPFRVKLMNTYNTKQKQLISEILFENKSRDLSCEEIADILGISAQSVYNNVSSAKKTIINILEKTNIRAKLALIY